jgi:CRP-like cAMP-binding protein
MPRAASHDLSGLPLLAGAPERDVAIFERLSRRVEFAPEQVLCREGAHRAGGFFVLLAGRVAVLRGGRLVTVLEAGDWFGELALHRADRMRSATVSALTVGSALEFGPAEYRILLDRVPLIRARINDAAASRLALAGSNGTTRDPDDATSAW